MNAGTASVSTQPSALTWCPILVSYILEAIWIFVHGVSSLFFVLTTWFKDFSTKRLKQGRVELTSPPSSETWKQARLGRCLSSQIKLTVVLDLDETLVLTYLHCKIPKELQLSVTLGRLRSLDLSCDLGNGKQRIVVFLRPGLTRFLHRLSSFCEVVLYSAAVRSYARPLVDALDPQHKVFSRRLFRDSTVCTGVYKYVKDLSKLGSDLSRTVLVDNRAFSFLLQPHNGIKCLPFRGNDKDRELNKVILPLLESLSFLKDVRPTLNNAFRMENWFKSKGFLL